MTSILDDLRGLPFLLACLVAVVAAAVLVVRIAALLVFVVADAAERGEAALTGAVGIPPITATVLYVAEGDLR